MIIRRLSALVAAIATTAGMLAATEPAQAGERDQQYYLSVGDSYAVGYQPNGDLRHGFAPQVVRKAQARGYDLSLVNLACGGATTTSILTRKGCGKARRAIGTKSYAPLTQTQAAVKFLRRHRGQVELVTISIGGNDVTRCGGNVPDPLVCVTEAAAAVRRNVTTLARTLRRAAGPKVLIVGTTYPDVLLGRWVYEPIDEQLARISVPVFQELINPALRTAYVSAGGRFVDVTRATGAYGSLDVYTDVEPYGLIPLPVARVCRLTWFCAEGDIHARTSGYGVIADLITRRLERREVPGRG